MVYYRKDVYPSVWSWIVIVLFLFTGCTFNQGKATRETNPLPPEGRIVVLGFIPALSPGEEPGVFQSPISGGLYMAEPVPGEAVDRLTENLFSRLSEHEEYDLISPKRAMGLFSNLIPANQGLSDLSMFQKIGKAFSADAVMAGYLYRWQDRRGTDYSVNSPASVAFDVYLLRSDDNVILWKGRFDKTQRSLSENLLEMWIFLKGKGKWMTVEELADLGLSEILGEPPSDGQDPAGE